MARSTLLSAAAGIGVAAATVFLVGKALDFSSVVSLPTPSFQQARGWDMPALYFWSPPGARLPPATMANIVHSYSAGDSFNLYYKVDAALALLGAIFMAAAFIAAAFAFLRDSEAPKRRLLAVSAGTFALYGGASLATGFIGATVLEHADWPVPASQAAGAGAALALLVAAAFIRTAVGSGVPSRRVAQGIKAVVLSPPPNRLLAWGCFWLAVYFGLNAAAGVTSRHALGRVPGSLSGGFLMAAVGEIVAALGAAIAGLAFSGRMARRDGTLAVAAVVIGLGFLITASGLIAQAVSSHDTSSWLEAVWSVGIAVAAGCGAAAFSGRLEQPHGPDIAVLA